MGSFELRHSSLVCDKIPVSEYVSKKSGLTVIIAQTDGPIVKGFFNIVTETFDDDGIPHILEHVLYSGSKQYPYKHALDLIAKRCLGSECYASSECDNICYIMETVGSEGFLTLVPVFLDFIFHPTLTEESFLTEVHHITGEGKDAGLVYTEMLDCDYGYPRLDLIIARNIYPGRCGYKSETCGLSNILRESVNMTKVRKFHKEFYRLENLKIVITGQIQADEVFNTLEQLEQQIISEVEGDRGPFQRPWQTPPPPLLESKDVIIKYRSDKEDDGVFCMAWRIGSCVNNSYTVMAIDILLNYLTRKSTSPLRTELVDTQPYASAGVSYHLNENSDTCASITFHDVPVSKLPDIKIELQTVFEKIIQNECIDMKCIEDTIKFALADKINSLNGFPQVAISCMLTPYLVYGNTEKDFQHQMNPQINLMKLLKEPLSFWLSLFQKYLVENKYVAIQCIPSKEEQEQTVKDENERIEVQIKKLGESGLKERADLLEEAIKFKEREPPTDMITSIPIPSVNSIKFHEVVRYRTDSDQKQPIDLSETPIFTCFDNLNTNFVNIFTILDTSNVPIELASYLPLLLKSLLQMPVERDGKIVPYEEFKAQLNDDIDYYTTSQGYGGEMCNFPCGNYSQTCVVSLKMKTAKYEAGFKLLKELLYKSVFTADKLQAVALKLNSKMADFKTNGWNMLSYAVNGMCFTEDSNIVKSGICHQNKFLTDLIQKLDNDTSKEVLENMETVRKIITKPSNIVLYVAGNLDHIKDPIKPISEFLPTELKLTKNQQKIIPTPDYKFLKSNDLPVDGCIIAIDNLDSVHFCQVTRGITSYSDPDLPALMLYLQYLAVNPQWKQMRTKEYLYNGKLKVEVSKGLLYLIYEDSNKVIEAYKETKEILTKQLITKEWNDLLLDIARNSLIVDLIDHQKSIDEVVNVSIQSYLHNVNHDYNRTFLDLVNQVTTEDLNRVGEKYISPLLNLKKVKTAVVANPSKITDIANGFEELGLKLTVYSSVEESFLNTTV